MFKKTFTNFQPNDMVVEIVEEDVHNPEVECPIEIFDKDENISIRMSVQGARNLALFLIEAAHIAEQTWERDAVDEDSEIKLQ